MIRERNRSTQKQIHIGGRESIGDQTKRDTETSITGGVLNKQPKYGRYRRLEQDR